ncbi:hypothetical protein J6590_063307 [Homalodisca vitripennis]|nr:hypothetical protein J6590_063307 [Homalodisca vitripennis]
MQKRNPPIAKNMQGFFKTIIISSPFIVISTFNTFLIKAAHCCKRQRSGLTQLLVFPLYTQNYEIAVSWDKMNLFPLHLLDKTYLDYLTPSLRRVNCPHIGLRRQPFLRLKFQLSEQTSFYSGVAVAEVVSVSLKVRRLSQNNCLNL